MKTKSILCFMLILGLSGSAIAQTRRQKARDKMADSMKEAEFNVLTLRFSHAVTGKPIESAEVSIQNIGEYVTDFEGKVEFPAPEEDGFYGVQFEKEDFITSVFKIEIMAQTLFFNRFSVSPHLPLGSVRIVLDWDETPRDLDAHLVKQEAYHISYRNKKVSDDGLARLDRDDTDGHGPETITANEVDARASYVYFVHNYSNRNDKNSPFLSESKACVKLYGDGDRLLHVYQVPRNHTGRVWPVFRIKDGKIEAVNEGLLEEWRF